MKNTNNTIDITPGLKEIEEKIKAIVKKNQDEIAKYEQEIKHAQFAEEKARKEKEEAKKKDDLDAYTELLDVFRKASDILDFYSGKLAKLKSEPIIGEEEYNNYTKIIKSELDELNRKNRVKAQNLLRELTIIEPELNINLEKGNDLLSILQHDLYKDDASMQKADGSRIRMDHLENRYKDYRLAINISTMVGSPVFDAVFKP